MKKLPRTYPDVSRLIIGALLLAVALIGSGFIHIPYLPAGCVLVVLVTWLLFRSEGLDLGVVGFDLTRRHLLLVPLGLVLGMGTYLLSFYVGLLVRGDQIAVNHAVNWIDLAKALWRILPTVVVQDFVVVGYCYVKLIQLTNKQIATVLAGLIFISMHDVWGGYFVNVLFYASGLFVGYLMFSTALLRSGSIWLVIGLHWGNNFINSCLVTFHRMPTSWLYISSPPHNDLNLWQAIGLFIAPNISAAGLIATLHFMFRSKNDHALGRYLNARAGT